MTTDGTSTTTEVDLAGAVLCARYEILKKTPDGRYQHLLGDRRHRRGRLEHWTDIDEVLDARIVTYYEYIRLRALKNSFTPKLRTLSRQLGPPVWTPSERKTLGPVDIESKLPKLTLRRGTGPEIVEQLQTVVIPTLREHHQ